MSRPKHDYYGYIKMRIMKYPAIKNERGIIPYLQWNAIEQELEELEKDPLNADRLKAIDMILFKKTHTIEGASQRLNYSYKTIQKWINDFVNNVSRKAGY